MKVLDWKSDSGVNYSVVINSINDLLSKRTMCTLNTEKPEGMAKTQVTIETDEGTYTAFSDEHGYSWLKLPAKLEQPPYRWITCSITKFLDEVYEHDKKIRLTAVE